MCEYGVDKIDRYEHKGNAFDNRTSALVCWLQKVGFTEKTLLIQPNWDKMWSNYLAYSQDISTMGWQKDVSDIDKVSSKEKKT